MVNYIPEPIRKMAHVFKDKVASRFKTNSPKDYGKKIVYGRGRKPSKSITQKQSEQNRIKSITKNRK